MPSAPSEPTAITDIDRHQLSVMKKRFRDIHSDRWQRAMEPLKSRQRMLLACIPALLHLNSPTLPGYTRSKQLAGIVDWMADEALLKQVKALWPAFNIKQRRHNKHNKPFIRSICVMGSVGSIAQSTTSDFDYWIVHNDLPDSEKPLLTRKLATLEHLAKRLFDGIQGGVHFRLSIKSRE